MKIPEMREVIEPAARLYGQDRFAVMIGLI